MSSTQPRSLYAFVIVRFHSHPNHGHYMYRACWGNPAGNRYLINEQRLPLVTIQGFNKISPAQVDCHCSFAFWLIVYSPRDSSFLTSHLSVHTLWWIISVSFLSRNEPMSSIGPTKLADLPPPPPRPAELLFYPLDKNVLKDHHCVTALSPFFCTVQSSFLRMYSF